MLGADRGDSAASRHATRAAEGRLSAGWPRLPAKRTPFPHNRRMALRSRARALLRGPEIQLRPAEAPPIAGRARLGRKTKDLVKRLRPGDIAVIDHADLDRIAAEDLVASGVAAVVNVAPSSTDRYPEPRAADPRAGGRACSSTPRRRRCSRSSPTATSSSSRAPRCAPNGDRAGDRAA